MFFKTADSKLVNLQNVTSIAFEEYIDRNNKEKFKIIFNMNYGVSLRSNPEKLISDYVYSVYNNREEFEDSLNILMELVPEYRWIKAKEPRIINPYHISFLTQDDKRNRIIINLATSASFHGNSSSITSDFVYINCSDRQEYETKLKQIQEVLEDLILF